MKLCSEAWLNTVLVENSQKDPLKSANFKCWSIRSVIDCTIETKEQHLTDNAAVLEGTMKDCADNGKFGSSYSILCTF